MNRRVFKYLENYTSDTNKINRLFVTAFLIKNNINSVNNELINSYIIRSTDNDYLFLEKFISKFEKIDIEDLIQLFEFVISPKDKIVNGAVYTPKDIRDYIVEESLIRVSVSPGITIADISCGCGSFLLTSAIYLQKLLGISLCEIYERNIWGGDIEGYSIERTKILLALYAITQKEDKKILNFNLYKCNALDFNWSKLSNGFDIIVGNPPYVCSRNIDNKSKQLLSKWEVTKSGHPDLYIPFFQIALESIKESGVLGYITVNTFFKSLNGRALRKYFSTHQFSFRVIDFKAEQVFKKRNTYTCVCIIKKTKSEFLEYCNSSSKSLKRIDDKQFAKSFYSSLDHFSGWNLGNKSVVDTIKKIEGLPTKIFPFFSFSTGIATLKNHIYKFVPIECDSKFFFFLSDSKICKIERGVCRKIINANKVTTEAEIENLIEYIIYPYNQCCCTRKINIINERDLKKNFPFAFKYLSSKRNELSQRDKGSRQYEAWYAYGRTQGLNIKGIKLFLPHITSSPSFVLCNDQDLLFCNGEAIVYEDEIELRILKKILESKIFWFYIVKTSKPYASGFYSLGKNYLRNFSIPDFTSEERTFILQTTDKSLLLDIFLKKYKISRRELDI